MYCTKLRFALRRLQILLDFGMYFFIKCLLPRKMQMAADFRNILCLGKLDRVHFNNQSWMTWGSIGECTRAYWFFFSFLPFTHFIMCKYCYQNWIKS